MLRYINKSNIRLFREPTINDLSLVVYSYTWWGWRAYSGRFYIIFSILSRTMEDLLKEIRYFFQIDNNTAATIILALTVFILGYFINGVIKYIGRLLTDYQLRINIHCCYKQIIFRMYLFGYMLFKIPFGRMTG